MKPSRTSSIPSNIPPCGTCGDEISALELKTNSGECFVCYLERQRVKVETDLASVRAQKVVAPSMPKLVPISLHEPTETLKPVAEILLDVSEGWELNKKRLLFALLAANPLMSAPLSDRVERASFAVNGKSIKSSKDLLKQYGHKVVSVTVLLPDADDGLNSPVSDLFLLCDACSHHHDQFLWLFIRFLRRNLTTAGAPARFPTVPFGFGTVTTAVVPTPFLPLHPFEISSTRASLVPR